CFREDPEHMMIVVPRRINCLIRQPDQQSRWAVVAAPANQADGWDVVITPLARVMIFLGQIRIDLDSDGQHLLSKIFEGPKLHAFRSTLSLVIGECASGLEE